MKKTAKRAAGVHRASLTKLHDLDAGLELMYYGWRGMTLEADVNVGRRSVAMYLLAGFLRTVGEAMREP